MTGSRGAQNTTLTDQELLDTICSTNFCNQLDNLGVPVSSITTNDQEAVLDTFWDGEKDRCDESFRVVRLLENNDLLSQAGAIELLA